MRDGCHTSICACMQRRSAVRLWCDDGLHRICHTGDDDAVRMGGRAAWRFLGGTACEGVCRGRSHGWVHDETRCARYGRVGRAYGGRLPAGHAVVDGGAARFGGHGSRRCADDRRCCGMHRFVPDMCGRGWQTRIVGAVPTLLFRRSYRRTCVPDRVGYGVWRGIL